jgi:hypothetical protein
MDVDGDGPVAAVRAHLWEITESFLNHTQSELEVARAMNDREAIIRSQIKMEVMKHGRYILDVSIEHVNRVNEVKKT